MNAFRRWLTSPLGYVVITAVSTLLLLAVAPRAFAEWGWLTYSAWLVPMLSAQSKLGRRCRVPRWLGGRGASA